MTNIEQLLDENKLIYLTDSTPGISRKKTGNNFTYLDKADHKITDEKQLKRIKSLVLPPAWTNVWIAPKPNAHLQATGIDQAGRKQYKYHPAWCQSRNENKFLNLLEFGKNLPGIRRILEADIKRKDLDERKVLAISVSFMAKTLVRIGNESYKQLYGSYGLSTLRDKHVKISGSNLKISFKGKKGIMHDIDLKDRRLANLVKKCRDIPGQELFQYYTATGERRSIDSGMVNNYIREITGCDFTAKNFRTWSGTMEAMRTYSVYDYPENETKRKKVTIAVLDQVSKKLGNTRSVCKKYYVFPALIEAYESGDLEPYLRKIKRNSLLTADVGLNADEKVLLSFLKAEQKRRKAA